MIEEIIICFISIALFLIACWGIAEGIFLFIAYLEKRKENNKILAQQKVDRQIFKIEEWSRCKWDDKVECRQGRSCDYCAMINCLREE